MPATPTPGQPPGHGSGRDLDAEALSRVLDGRALRPDASAAEQAAHARAEDDVDALTRAFALIGDALAEEPPGGVAAPVAPAAAAAVSAPGQEGQPERESEAVEEEEEDAGAVVLPFAARLRRRAPILAAAASLVAVVGLGAVLVGNNGLGSSESDTSAIAQAPADDAPAAVAESAEAYAQGRDAVADSAGAAAAAEAAPKAAKKASGEDGADESGPLTGAGDPATGLEEAPQPKPPASSTTQSAASALDAAVACNRGILVGRVLTLSQSGDGFQLTVAVDERIAGGNQVSFQVGENYARTPDGRKDLTVGREFLFVIPKSPGKAVYGFAQPTSADRQEVADARERTADADC